jgi:hypothetical protein
MTIIEYLGRKLLRIAAPPYFRDAKTGRFASGPRFVHVVVASDYKGKAVPFYMDGHTWERIRQRETAEDAADRGFNRLHKKFDDAFGHHHRNYPTRESWEYDSGQQRDFIQYRHGTEGWQHV